MTEPKTESTPRPSPTIRKSDLILIGILLVGAALRFSGQNWDHQTHMHPDERFLTGVETKLEFPETLLGYFDTATSRLNPHNNGDTFFVYGTLPIFIVRILGEWAGETDYSQIHLVGRTASATFDLLSVYIIFLIGTRLYNRRVGLLAAAFGALSVLPIQHAHFFVVESFANTFILGGIYFAVRALDEDRVLNYALFGLFLGMATASKVSAFPLAGVIVLASAVRLWGSTDGITSRRVLSFAWRVALAALISLITFRILQPYAFKSFSLALNPAWVENLKSLSGLSSGDSDFPPGMQWANRTPVWFSFKNLVLHGLGWPLGLLAWGSWGWALARAIRGDWQRHLIPVVWTGAYFLWRSIGFVTAMRYQLPVYPTLALLAAWGLWHAWDLARGHRLFQQVPARWAVAASGGFVLAATMAYATAFALNYTRPFTRYEASAWMYRNLPGPVNVVLDIGGASQLEPIALAEGTVLDGGGSLEVTFRAREPANAVAILVPYASAVGEGSLRASLLDDAGAFAQGAAPVDDGKENRLEIRLDPPVALVKDTVYRVRLDLADTDTLAFRGSVIVTETSWDDALPLPIEERSAFPGLYSGVNLELYWSDPDDADGTGVSDKLERMVSNLNAGDYVIITSNRQYGSVGRLPQKYPLTAAYYRALFGCPVDKEVEQCAARARPGEVHGRLGFDLVATFERNPTLGPLVFRDQLAEEAFTVYDHPKVLVFAKSPEFDSGAVLAELSAVDLSRIVNIPPSELGPSVRATDLLLPDNRLEAQRSGGTWSDLFPRGSLINVWEPLSVVFWWLTIGLLGIIAFPIVRAAFPGLSDGGYPLARLVGLLAIAWGSWLASSLMIAPYTRATIVVVVLGMTALSAFLTWRDRDQLRRWLRERRREILWVELVALGFFLFDLAIRLGNPDLWHRFLGGEKPMDFSYLNAVLKSTSFPPFDPWYAGGYINYYYFGFVLVGTPIKLIGIVPSVAYNLVLPTLFALSALGAYAVGTNLVARLGTAYPSARIINPRVAGLAAALSLLVLGNLGTVRLIYDNLREVGLRGTDGSRPGLVAAVSGLGKVLTLQEVVPAGGHHWYWDPSRAISAPPPEAGPITEFPFFTFLYADLHAHMINIPLTVLAMAWSLSWVLAADKRIPLSWPGRLLGIGLGGLILGALGPTNTWDFPVYWTLGGAAAMAAPLLRYRRLDLRVALEAGLSVAALMILARLLYQPYYAWYGAGYTKPGLWGGARTSLDSYLTVHGLYLVVLIPWMAWETRQWLAATPLSALSRLRPYFPVLLFGALTFLVGLGYLAADGVRIAPLVGLIVGWAGLLLLRKDAPIEKRAVLIMIGSAAALTFLVEVVVLIGDIGRMNTVFKFYLQVWTLFSLAGGAALVWLLADLPAWGLGTRRAWSVAFGAVLFGAALYPLTATRAKIEDRMAPATPVSLDGMAFMSAATYDDLGRTIPLEGDYHAIQWMQEHVEGSPVIVEAQLPEYRWGSRYSIYTGLPAVLGWNWHQRQQRAAAEPTDIFARVQDIWNFYLTPSTNEALTFLSRYDVQYVVVGELERLYYGSFDGCAPVDGGARVVCDLAGRYDGIWTLDVPVDQCQQNGTGLSCPTRGLDKFELMSGQGYLRPVYQNGATTIYEVLW